MYYSDIDKGRNCGNDKEVNVKKSKKIIGLIVVLLLAISTVAYAGTYNYANTTATVTLYDPTSCETTISSSHGYVDSIRTSAYTSLRDKDGKTLAVGADSGESYASATAYYSGGGGKSAYGSWNLYIDGALVWSSTGSD
ncbi:MAG: hypothetical protein PHG06_17675 [Parabacteroides sp.]|nr:hypothetical protein [Parabacteroides sp.]